MTLDIVAGALLDAHGRVLIAQRPAGKELAGRWEFPGGKLRSGEDRLAGLTRELHEELGIDVTAGAAAPLIRYSYEYPDKTVRLDLWTITAWRGEPAGLDGQALLWVPIPGLRDVDLLEADRPMVDALIARVR